MYLADGSAIGEPLLADAQIDDAVALAAVVAFLLSTAMRRRLPLLPLTLGLLALVVVGRPAMRPSTACWQDSC